MFHEDPALPYLPTALDPTAMQTLLQREWATPAGARISDCQIERVKYRPGERCIISYLLQIAQPGAAEAEQRLCAYLYPPGQSAGHFVKAQQEGLTQPPVGLALCHLPGWEIVVRAFPNDRKLTTLAALTDPATLQRELLPPLLAAHWGEDWQIDTVQAQVAQYFPEHNCMLRVEAQLTQPGTRQQQTAVLYAKTYYNQAGSETYHLMETLWRSDARRAGQLALAQPLGYDAERKILWQRGLLGETLLTYETQPACFAHYLAQAARLIATLHQQTIPVPQVRTRDGWLDRLGGMAEVLARIWPAGEERSRALLTRLARQAATLDPEPVALLHGDLHLQNFLIAEAKPVLIDLDDLCLGSPWQEIGSFLAGLHYRSVRTGTSPAAVDELAVTFCQHYAAYSSWPLSLTAIRWYTATALINERIARLTARLTKGNLAEVIKLFDRAAAIAENL